jgi:hypothetical protein
MREYMAKVGTMGHRMMKQTCTVQANIDYSDERDAMRNTPSGEAPSPRVRVTCPRLDEGSPGRWSSRRES